MFKLAHISDVHLGPLPALTLRELASKRITGYVNWHRNRRRHLFPQALEMVLDDVMGREPDHLAITGDLVNLASGTEILAARQWLELVGPAEFATVVPGNHDAYVPGAYQRAMNHWHDYVRGDGTPATFNSKRHLFPALRRRGPVAVIGCSTAVATPPFSASGFFSDRQADALADLLRSTAAEGLCRVVMIHHPPVRGATELHKRMIGIGRFQAAIAAAGAELVLHGHTHLDTVYWLKGPDGARVPVVGIASASQGPGGRKPRAGYNLFTIAREENHFHIWRDRHQLTADGARLEKVETTDFSTGTVQRT